MRLRGQVIGALNMFGTQTGEMDAADARVIQALADIATIGFLQERAISRREMLTEQLRAALNSRIVVEQAEGVLADAGTPDEAFGRLINYCRSNGSRLTEVACTRLLPTREVCRSLRVPQPTDRARRCGRSAARV